MQPLDDVKVLDLSVYQQVPYAAAILGDFGANVIKIEGPSSPDPGRGVVRGAGPSVNLYWESHNRNKRSVVIDLKSPGGREVLYKLVESADVFLQNLGPGTAARLGVDFETLKQRNPKLIYGVGSAYGLAGPDSSLPGVDQVGQARAGLMVANGYSSMPPFPALSGTVDQASAFLLVSGILLALRARDRTGKGQLVDTSLLGAAILLQGFQIPSLLRRRKTGQGSKTVRPDRYSFNPLYTLYEASDRWFALSTLQLDRYWKAFREAVGTAELPAELHTSDIAENPALIRRTIETLEVLFKTNTARYWVDLLRSKGLIAEVTQEHGDLTQDPQITANGYLVEAVHPSGETVWVLPPPVKLSETPGTIRCFAPEFGQDTELVLLESGFSWDEIAQLRDAGAIGEK